MKKISLKNNINKLSRNEMKNIAGGDFGIGGGIGIGGGTPSCGEDCSPPEPGETRVDCSKNTSCPRCFLNRCSA